MRLGLVGRGPQAQRYLMPKNGGNYICAQWNRDADCTFLDWLWLEEIDAVIIATHPEAHFEQARIALEHGKPVLVEKPLAMTLWQCNQLLDIANRRGLACEVAHTHLWSANWVKLVSSPAYARWRIQRQCNLNLGFTAEALLRWTPSAHDYSPWLDWGPHALALLEDSQASECRLTFEKSEGKKQLIVTLPWGEYNAADPEIMPPMLRMVEEFRGNIARKEDPRQRNEFNRRIYRALFSEEHGQGK